MKGEGWWEQVLSVLAYPFFMALFVVILLGLAGYLVAQYNSSNFQPFDLATVVGLLGGFSFTIAFSDKCPDALRKNLRLVGALYLLATISFVVLGLFIPVDKLRIEALTGWLTWIIPLSFYLGAVPFAIAVFLTLLNIGKIIRGR